MKRDLKVEVSKYMSYLLRHNPENLKMDRHGFVSVEELLEKLKELFPGDKRLVIEIIEKSDKKRFEVIDDKIRALYGHTIPVRVEWKKDKRVNILFHGTTPSAALQILKNGLKSMRREWVHLSPTIEIATEVGMRRTQKPTILEIDAEAARRDGVKFFRATEKVYLCKYVAAKYITQLTIRKDETQSQGQEFRE